MRATAIRCPTPTSTTSSACSAASSHAASPTPSSSPSTSSSATCRCAACVCRAAESYSYPIRSIAKIDYHIISYLTLCSRPTPRCTLASSQASRPLLLLRVLAVSGQCILMHVLHVCSYTTSAGMIKGWFPTLIGYSAQGFCKFGFYEIFKDLYSNIAGHDLYYEKRDLVWFCPCFVGHHTLDGWYSDLKYHSLSIAVVT